MALLYQAINGEEEKIHPYARKFKDQLKISSTVYVGNLSFYTTEEQIIEVFKKCGEIRRFVYILFIMICRIIMGLNRVTKTPCGFCFVEFYTHQDAMGKCISFCNLLDSVKYLTSTTLDDRVIRVELDPGFAEGRQYGRGKQGGQVRDEFRTQYDPGICIFSTVCSFSRERRIWCSCGYGTTRIKEAKSRISFNHFHIMLTHAVMRMVQVQRDTIPKQKRILGSEKMIVTQKKTNTNSLS